MPDISVIVPVYKVENLLHRCVDSILGQSYADFELILVDDGSPDKCGTICDEYAAKDSRVAVIHQENGGLAAARNSGIDWVFSNSDSQWITFVDSDDWVHPDYLAVLLRIALQHRAACAICEAEKVLQWKPHQPYLGESVCLAAETAYSNYHEVTIVAWGKLFKRRLFENVRFPLGRLHEDAMVIYKILFQAARVAICLDPLYYYFQNPNGIMNSQWNPRRLDEIDAHEEQITFLQENNYTKALTREVHMYLRVLARHLVATCAIEEFRPYSKSIRKKLRKALLKYKRQYGFEVNGNEWVFENAFPNGMKLYWLSKAVVKRLHRVLLR